MVAKGNLQALRRAAANAWQRLSGTSRLAGDKPWPRESSGSRALFRHHVDNPRMPPDPGATRAKATGKGRTLAYCFSAAYWLEVPRSLSVIAMVIVFPSGATVMR